MRSRKWIARRRMSRGSETRNDYIGLIIHSTTRVEEHVRIGILGSGLMGGKLGTIFVRAGHEVVFSYSRDDAKLERLARDSGGIATAGSPADAVRDADVVFLAVHWSRIDDVLRQAG